MESKIHKIWDDRRVEKVIGNLLRVGVLSAAAVVLTGGIIFIYHSGGRPANYRVFEGEPSDLREIGGIFGSAMLLKGRGIIQLGLLLLIATPIARVGFSFFGFLAEKDRMYAGFTLIVLMVLLYSLVGS